jgi:hypothetical protein
MIFPKNPLNPYFFMLKTSISPFSLQDFPPRGAFPAGPGRPGTPLLRGLAGSVSRHASGGFG